MGQLLIALVSEHACPVAVHGDAEAGGQNVHVAALAAALGQQGATVVVYTRRHDPATRRRIRLGPGVLVEHIEAGPPARVPKDLLVPHMRQFAAGLSAAWRAARPDVAHAHYWMSGWAALSAARPLGIPVVQTFHSLGVVKQRHLGARDPSPPERIPTERFVCQRADLVIATCCDERRELGGMHGDMDRVAVLPCGVDLAWFRPGGPAIPPPSGLLRVVTVSRLVRHKGIEDVIAALPGLPQAELLVAGGPPAFHLAGDAEARRLMALAARLGVADRVRLLGRVGHDQVPALLRSADVAVCASWYEPFGIAALEAMACGVPVVVTAVGGMTETITNGRTGIHVAPRRPDLIAAALHRLFADPGLRRRLSAAGARRARRRYGWHRIGRSTLSLYETAIRTARS